MTPTIPPDDPGIGRRFQAATSYLCRPGPPRRAVPPGQTDQDPLPALDLPPGLPDAAPADLWQVVAARRSVRRFRDQAIPFDQLAALLWATQGPTGRVGPHRLRAAPSAGALYPVDTWVVVNRVDGVAAGVWRLDPDRWRLHGVRAGDWGVELARAALGQAMVAQAACTFCWTAVMDRSTGKYGQRAYRYVYLDAGHIAAHLSLAAEALGLGSCAIAALFDHEVAELLGVDPEREPPLYLTAVGVPDLPAR